MTFKNVRYLSNYQPTSTCIEKLSELNKYISTANRNSQNKHEWLQRPPDKMASPGRQPSYLIEIIIMVVNLPCYQAQLV